MKHNPDTCPHCFCRGGDSPCCYCGIRNPNPESSPTGRIKTKPKFKKLLPEKGKYDLVFQDIKWDSFNYPTVKPKLSPEDVPFVCDDDGSEECMDD